MILGCIADDLTGATDLALMLARSGMRTVQITGVPDQATIPPDADAVVVAMKSRTNPASEAVDMSLAACDWLKTAGAKQIFFKYCSTFDSTDDGNIGPVASALMARLGASVTIACPSFPENGRSTYMGHLFVGEALLSDSPLKDHPLTPMTDANLVRVLSRQTSTKVDLLPYTIVDQGAEAIRKFTEDRSADESVIFIADALDNAHLRSLGTALYDLPLITGGSGVAQGLADAYRSAGWLASSAAKTTFQIPTGPSVILSGSCSQATREQVAQAKETMKSFEINVRDLADGRPVATDILTGATKAISAGDTVLIHSGEDPEAVAEIQAELGRAEAGDMVETCMRKLAVEFYAMGVRRFVVAGGETSGAVVEALGVKALEIGPEIDPGVPWTRSVGEDAVVLALKSGNFGSPDFFSKALHMLK